METVKFVRADNFGNNSLIYRKNVKEDNKIYGVKKKKYYNF